MKWIRSECEHNTNAPLKCDEKNENKMKKLSHTNDTYWHQWLSHMQERTHMTIRLNLFSYTLAFVFVSLSTLSWSIWTIDWMKKNTSYVLRKMSKRFASHSDAKSQWNDWMMNEKYKMHEQYRSKFQTEHNAFVSRPNEANVATNDEEKAFGKWKWNYRKSRQNNKWQLIHDCDEENESNGIIIYHLAFSCDCCYRID